MSNPQFAYEVEGEGIPLLFIHQVASDRRLWYHQRMHFRDHYRFISVNVFGHGANALPQLELSLDRTAQAIHCLIESLGSQPVFLIGVSLGAAIAVRAASVKPSLVEGLVLISPWTHADEHVGAFTGRLVRLIETDGMAAHLDLLLRYIFPPAYLDSNHPEVERLRFLALQQDARVVAGAWTVLQAVDLRGELQAVRVPSLVIAGMNDLFTPPYLARAIAERLPQAELECWEESGHFPFLEDPARFNRRVEAFIVQCLARARLRGEGDGASAIYGAVSSAQEGGSR
jgi:pimeloyl-ACP methyl ester carboxylesterase